MSKEIPNKEELTNVQFLDNNYEQFYFVPYPDCKYFDQFDDDDHVVPVNTQAMCGSFVHAEWAANGCKDE